MNRRDFVAMLTIGLPALPIRRILDGSGKPKNGDIIWVYLPEDPRTKWPGNWIPYRVCDDRLYEVKDTGPISRSFFLPADRVIDGSYGLDWRWQKPK